MSNGFHGFLTISRKARDVLGNAACLGTVISVCLLLGLIGCPQKSPTAVPPSEKGKTKKSKKITTTPIAKQVKFPTLLSFTEVALHAGVDFHRNDDIRGRYRLQEENGGGVALFDFDGDSLPDIFLTNGCKLPHRKSDQAQSNELYRNMGNGKFEPVTYEANLFQSGFFFGCAVGDFNCDGFDDLYVTAFGRNTLWRNNGDGTFEDVTEQTATVVPAWSSSAAFADLNGDGFLDLYVVNYVKDDLRSPRLCPNRQSPTGYIACPPQSFAAAPDVLLISDGHGAFHDVSKKAGIIGSDGKGLGVAIFDSDRNGRMDVFVANDGTPNFLYLNAIEEPKQPHDKQPMNFKIPSFVDRAASWGVALNSIGESEACMGVAVGDYNRDGWTDLFVTNFLGETNTLYHNLAGEAFGDSTAESRLAAPSRSTLGFGTEFFDADNDGWLDLIVANGHISDNRWMGKDQAYRMPPQLFQNVTGKRFVDVSKSCGDYFLGQYLGRGVAVSDLDNDGDLDVVVSHQLDRSALLRNDTPRRYKSVIIKLIGRQSNRNGVGAVVEAEGLETAWQHEVIGGGSFHSSSDRRVHIGLGKHSTLPSLSINWPSGSKDQWPNLKPGHYVAVENGGLHELTFASSSP